MSANSTPDTRESTDDLSELRAELAGLRAEVDRLKSEGASHSPTLSPATANLFEPTSAVTRRNWMKAAAASAVAGTAVALGSNEPVAAANGDNFRIGNLGVGVAQVATSPTQLNYTGTEDVAFVVQSGTTFSATSSSINAAIGGWTSRVENPVGVYGFSSVVSSSGYGVIGRSDGRAGVEGRGNRSAVTGVRGLGGIQATGVEGAGRDGLDGLIWPETSTSAQRQKVRAMSTCGPVSPRGPRVRGGASPDPVPRARSRRSIRCGSTTHEGRRRFKAASSQVRTASCRSPMGATRAMEPSSHPTPFRQAPPPSRTTSPLTALSIKVSCRSTPVT